MSGPVLDIGMAYCGDWSGLMMTLSGLSHQRFFDGLESRVSFSVVDNLCDHTAGQVRTELEKFGAKYIPLPSPVGTGPPRDRLFLEEGAPWQAVIDDHMQFAPGDLAWLAEFCANNFSDDLYHGVMLASHVGKDGKPTIRWTHCNLRWSDEGLFGQPVVNPAAADPDCPPFRIPNGRLGFFMARRASWLGLHPEQRGFGCEGYLPLRYLQAGRSVWCLPHVRTTHVFALEGQPPKRPNRWKDRARNYLHFWRDLQKNPHLTFAGIKHTHCREGRLSPEAWGKILAELQIDEVAALAADPPLLQAQPVVSSAKPQQNVAAWQNCLHRGAELRRQSADLCGLKGKAFSVFACAIHGECTTTRFCKKQPARLCYDCEDARERPEPAKVVKPVSDVAVVIPCHNYGRFLPDAIESVFEQTTPPAEIIVIDDASTDETPTVTARYSDRGVRYERIDAHSVYQARRRGMALTTAPFLVFLDADDKLAPDYLEEGRACFTASNVGMAFTDLHRFGDEVRVSRYDVKDIEQGNYIHAGAMVRRVALEQSQAYEATDNPVNITADWYTWREAVRAGWHAKKFDAVYHYRQHGAGIHLVGREVTFYEEANLHLETVPVILPLSGRDRWWDQLTQWVEQQPWPRIEVIVFDSSGRPEFQQRTRSWLASLECATTYLPLTGSNGLADADRTRKTCYRAVQRIMPTIYRHLDRTTREYNLIIEDDVLPPRDAIERLLQAMTANAAAVSGVVRSRYQDALICWDDQRCLSIPQPRAGVQKIYGSGFGCLLYRRSVFSRLMLHHDGNGNFDHEVSHDITRLGRDWLINWGVQCVHAGLPAVVTPGADLREIVNAVV